MKRILMLTAVCLIAVLAFTHNGQSRTKSYYSGDAISHGNQVYVGTTNTGSLEVFKLENKELKLLTKIRPFDARFNRYDNFYDAKFSEEDGRLYVYVISGFTLYKYELVNDSLLTLIDKQQNTYWEWYTRVDKFDGNIVTISDKGVKVWNNDLQVIDAYDVNNAKSPYNVRGYNNKNIINVDGNYVTVFNRESRSELQKIAVNFKTENGNHGVYQDEANNLYIVDDYYAKKYNLDGQLLGSFKHLDYQGFDMAASGHNDYVYFTNGIGIVKLNKDNMKEIANRFVYNLGGAQSWAMGMKVVYADGDKIVVFDNSNILVLDGNLRKLASFNSSEQDDEKYATENLYLNLDHNFGSPYSTITVSGGGYFPNEDLSIDFAGTKTTGTTDAHGRFKQDLIVPNITPAKNVDIKVDGQSSKLTYSISFKIQ